MSDNLYEKLSSKRKDLQNKGLIPLWYTTGGLQLFEQKYEYETNGESVFGQFKRIAKTAASHLKGTKFEKDAETSFFQLLWNGWLSPSTPVLSNMGTDRGMPVSCSGTTIPDSVDGFYRNLREVAILTKNGFGTASDFSRIRPRGATISKGGKANGVVPVIREHVTVMRNVSQGTARRGAWAAYLDIEHGDFYELAEHMIAEPDNLNVGWTIRQSFIDKLDAGDSEAIARYQKALKVKMITGKGYFFFVDKANAKRPRWYKDQNLEINNSQLCSEIMLHNSDEYTYTCQPNFATIIKKGTGLCTFKDISVGDKIWSKEGWTTVVNKVSSGIKNVNKYSTPIGSFIGTEDHRVLENNIKIEVKNAKQIDGVKVDYAKIDNILPEYVIDGLVIGDGTFRNNQTKLCVGKKDQDYYNSEISHMIEHEGYLYFRKVKINSLNIENKTYERDIDLSYFKNNTAIASFIRGIMSANGAAIKQKDGRVNLVLTASSKVLIEKIQLLMQSLGMTPRLYNQKENDYTFKNGTYKSKKIYRLAILKDDDLNYFENNIGFIQKYKNEILKNRKLSSKIANRKLIGKISNIENLGEHEVFHIEVDNDSHTYWTGGLNVSNCVLSSMNVARYDEWKDTDAVYWATVFLDCVASEFIERAKDVPGLEKAVEFTRKGRALGLGQCGLHTLFMQKMLPFESFEAHRLSQEIAGHIARQSHEASRDMGEALGEPDWMKGYGLRNTHRIAIAPTKQTALIMGGISEGINPDPAMTYTQLTAAGEIDRINPVLLELMKSKGVYNRKNIQQIIDKQGSVQHVDWLTDEEKEVFKTAFEINQKAIIRMAAARGIMVDQWMSLNLFFAADEDPAWISEVHREAFENENILALYYIYTQAGVQASKGECEACQ